MKTMKRFGFPSAVVLLAIVGAAVLFFTGQETAGQSSDGWRQLSLHAFVVEIERITSASDPVSNETWAQIRSQSAERLVGAIDNNTAASYDDLVSLYLWGRSNLTDAQRVTVQAGLTPKANQVSPWSFDKLQTVHARMQEADLPAATIHALALRWLENRDLRTLDDVDQLGWLQQELQMVDRDASAAKEFSVRWSGSIQAPADGSYTFSICPLDLSFKNGGAFRTQSMSVSIAGEKVFDSANSDGSSESDPVTLATGQKTPIRIDFAYACSDPATFARYPAAAVLQWEGAGMSKRLVPTSAFFTPDGQEAGLQGAYVLKANGHEVRKTRVDPQVDFIWYHGAQVLPTHPTLRTALADRLFAVATSPTTLAAWESEELAARADWVGANWALLESLTAKRQKQWAQTLIAHPVLMNDCSRQASINLYRGCRFGTLNDALQLFGLWAKAHADEQPALATHFYRVNRLPYRKMANSMVWEYRKHLDQLKEDFLITPDGGCALPVATTLAYGAWLEKRIGQWIEELDTKLADQQLVGDPRASWLLARAQAEEIRHGRSGRYWKTQDHYLAGQQWIEEATLVAQSEPTRLGAFQQLAARFAGNEQLAAARRVLDQAQPRCTGPASTQLLTQWRDALTTLESAFQQQHKQQETLARDAYIEQLRTRYQKAQDNGDTEATSRYEQLLTDAGATTE